MLDFLRQWALFLVVVVFFLTGSFLYGGGAHFLTLMLSDAFVTFSHWRELLLYFTLVIILTLHPVLKRNPVADITCFVISAFLLEQTLINFTSWLAFNLGLIVNPISYNFVSALFVLSLCCYVFWESGFRKFIAPVLIILIVSASYSTYRLEMVWVLNS